MTPMISILIAVFCARHLPQLLLDYRNRGRAVTHARPSSIRAGFLVAMYAATLVAAMARFVTIPVPATGAGAAALFVSGAVLGMTALRALGSNYAEELLVFDGAPLVADGIYGVIRHPLRLGLTLEMMGLAALAEAPLLVLLIAVTIVAQSIRSREEAELLRRAFGQAADDYIRQVPAINLPLGLLRSWRRGRTRWTPMDPAVAGTSAR